MSKTSKIRNAALSTKNIAENNFNAAILRKKVLIAEGLNEKDMDIDPIILALASSAEAFSIHSVALHCIADLEVKIDKILNVLLPEDQGPTAN